MAEVKGAESKFVYVTYIRTTPEKLWRALSELKKKLEDEDND